ncbi:7188_t:CDS:2 [Paraglomus occultum]|uniref:7188_t:CDS:1 n=1 Tax=Paraglomus occultum TaxID=144539 RepID=A0A9N8VUL0_9GLOM|nr:7188_t:CDS:2 [Paraglomus occultum]
MTNYPQNREMIKYAKDTSEIMIVLMLLKTHEKDILMSKKNMFEGIVEQSREMCQALNQQQTQEDYSKYLEIQLTVQQKRCVELNDKWNSAENQSRMHKIYLNETRKSLEETKKSLNEARESLNKSNIKEEVAEYHRDNEEIRELRRQYKTMEERYVKQMQINETNQRIIDQYKSKSDGNDEVLSLRQQNRALSKALAHNMCDMQRLNNELEEMQQKYKDAEARAAELQKKNDLLKEESIKYQEAVGDTTKEFSAGPSRNDPLTELEMEIRDLRIQKAELDTQLRETRDNFNLESQHLQLEKDVVKLQNNLYDFTQVKGRHVAFNEQGISALLKSYGCQLDPTSKLIVSSALQRYTIEKVVKRTKIHFDTCIGDLGNRYTKTDLNYFLEGLILNTAASLKQYIKDFVEMRKGEDELTRMAGVKISQHVYTVLRNHGFAQADHPVLVNEVTLVLSELEKCRQIKDESKRKYIEELAPSIVLEIIRLFCFRFQTQIPAVEYHFFESGAKFDSVTMECSLVEDGEGENQIVEICSFPLIGVNILDEQKRQIFSKAQVQLRPSGWYKKK